MQTKSEFRKCMILLCALDAISTASGADIPVDTKIDRVTVYRQGAVVTRTGEVSIPAGTQRLVLRGLPAGIDSKTLRVEVSSNSARLGGIELATVNEGKFVADAERELRRKLEEKTDARAVIQDDISAAETQLKLLDSLAGSPTGSANRAGVDASNLANVLATMSTGAASARTKIREAKVKARNLDREIETINADLKKVATQRKQSSEVRASVAASSATSSSVSVSYSVQQASWDWIYQARLDTVKKRVALERQGQVTQQTGEDWQNVQLTLTNAEPEEDVAAPVVNSIFVGLEEAEPPPNRREFRKRVSAPAAGMTELESVVVTAQMRTSSEVRATQYATEYKIPGRISLLADREPRLYLIAEDTFDVDLVARVVPSMSRSAHLEASLKYEQDVPIDSGELQLYRDDVYVGQAETRGFLQGADVRLPFGSDDRVRVVLREEPSQSAQRGIIKKENIRESRQRFEITNTHPMPISLEVIERLPVSRNADVHVEVLKGATEPTTKDFGGKAGVLLWKYDAQPQKPIVIRHLFSIRYPKDRALASEEGEEE